MIQRDKCEEEEQYPHLKAKREGGRCKPLCRMWGSRLGAAALKKSKPDGNSRYRAMSVRKRGNPGGTTVF